MTTIILIRHGESEANRGEFFAGHLNPELEERGLQQAKLTARYIAEHYRVDAVYASDLTRAYKTAECLADILQMPIIKEEGMREINAGAWEGVSFDELWNLYPEDFGTWRQDIANARCTDGESVAELGKRVFKTLTGIAEKEKGKTVVVATHATPVRAMQSIVTTGSVQAMQEIPWVSNASLTVFEYEDNKWSLIEAGIDKHLSECATTIPTKV